MQFNITTRPKIGRNKWGVYSAGSTGKRTINITYNTGGITQGQLTSDMLDRILDDYISKDDLSENYYNKTWIDASFGSVNSSLMNIDTSINRLEDKILNINTNQNHVLLTQDEYDSLGNKDPNTVYLFKGSHYVLISQSEYDALPDKDNGKIYLITK